ncbi:MAG: hypothetical protein DRP95_05315 [Candidatus Latescibacterota bacterium]|nr:MAG: hypothetical protein DRP95_05315 [Candidatus Latescibacterota bacterium]
MHIWTVIPIFLLGLSCTFRPDLGGVRESLEGALEPSISPEVQLKLGFPILDVVKLLAVCTEEGREAWVYLKEIKGIEVGVYKVDGTWKPIDSSVLRKLEGRLGRKKWQKFVVARDGKDLVYLFYRLKGKVVEELLAVVLSEDELVVAKVKGNFRELLSRFLEEGKWVRQL